MVALMFMGSTLVTPLYAPYRQAFGFAEVTLTLVYSVYARCRELPAERGNATWSLGQAERRGSFPCDTAQTLRT